MISPFWDKTLTIYTKIYDSANKKTSWYRYMCDNCFYGLKDVNVLKGTDIARENIHIARIPYNESYMSYRDWCSCTQKEKHLSITIGSIIVYGSVLDVISDNSSGNDLIKKYSDKCFKVSIFKENDTFAIKHYYAGGD